VPDCATDDHHGTVTLIVLRHGHIASQRGDLRLTPDGRTQATRVGQWFAEQQWCSISLLASPTAPTVETAECFRRGYQSANRGVTPVQLHRSAALRNPDLYLGGQLKRPSATPVAGQTATPAERLHPPRLKSHLTAKEHTVSTTLASNEGDVQLPAAPPPPAPSSNLAAPAAWAVTAFGTTSFMLGVYNTGLLPASSAVIVVPVAFFFGGLTQIIVAVLEVIRGNLFGAVVFGTYGPFWVIYGAIQTFFAGSIPAADIGAAIALLLAMFAVVTAFLLVAALRTDAVLVAIFVLILVGLVFLAVGAGSGSSRMTEIGGWFTLAFALLAWYHAAADVIAATFGRPVLPVFPLVH
jgi:succinate-acetate transporter protein